MKSSRRDTCFREQERGRWIATVLEERSNKKREGEGGAQPGPDVLLLVTGDDSLHRHVREVLGAYALERVDSVGAARAALEAGRHALVLVDGALDGRRGRSPPRLFLTGPGAADLAEAARGVGAADCVPRGDAALLARAVRYALEQRRAAAALRASEKRFRSLVQNGADVISLVDARGVILFESPSVTRALGYLPEEMVGKDGFSFVHPDDRARLRDAFGTLLREGRVETAPFRFRHAAGGWRWFECVQTNLLGDPAVGAVVINGRDVTERLAQEDALARSEARLRLATEAAGVGVFNISDPAGGDHDVAATPEWSDRAKAIFGLRPHDLLDRARFLGLVHPDDREDVVRLLRRPATPSGEISLEHRVVRPDGAVRWVAVRGRLRFEGSGPAELPVGIDGTVADVTERKEAEARRERGAAFRILLLSFVGSTLQRGLDERFYDRLLRCVCGAVRGAGAGSLLLRGAGGRYAFAAAVNYDLEALQACRFEPEEMRDLRGGAPRLLRKFSGDLNDARRRVLETAGASNIKVTLCIPVMCGGEMVACVNLDSLDSPDAFDDESVETAQVFAQQAGALLARFALERELQEGRAALERLAYYDPLTGLPNRRLFKDRLAALTAPRGTPLALLLLDLDDFKGVNDRFGHDVGDGLLQEVAERLRGCVRAGDTVARLGGDEFVLLLPGAGAVEAEAVAAAVTGSLAQPFDLPGREVRTAASIGIEVYAPDGASEARASSPTSSTPGAADLVKSDLIKSDPVESDLVKPGAVHDLTQPDLMRHADIALHRAKALGKGGWRVFTGEMSRRLLERAELEGELRAALSADALMLHFQPRVALRTGRVLSLEALVRWRHPARGLVPPGVFVPLAEETDLILRLGERVLDLACAQAKRWEASGVGRRLSVNVSAKQLEQPDIVATVRDCLERHALGAHWLELEITESTAMKSVEDSIAKLGALRALGVAVSVDDFGTAYSSLSYLKRLPLDSLKIDRSFVSDLAEDPAQSPHDASIVRAIVALGKSLGLTLVAEGVETPAQRSFLESLGCDEAQGYLFGRPLPAPELEGRLRHG